MTLADWLAIWLVLSWTGAGVLWILQARALDRERQRAHEAEQAFVRLATRSAEICLRCHEHGSGESIPLAEFCDGELERKAK